MKYAKLLLISKFFYPDLNPPSFRFYEMLKFIRSKTNWHISVITTFPHYRISDGNTGKNFENINGIEVHRIRCPIFKKKNANVFHEVYLQNLLSDCIFSIKACIKSIFLEKYDVVICTSPPVFVLITGIFIHITRKSDLIIDVRDLWTETRIELGLLKCKPMIKILKSIEQIALSKANVTTCTTKGIKDIMKKKIKNKKIEFLPNGIDTAMIFKKYSKTGKISKSKKFTILYAGRVGRLQNLLSLIEGFLQLESFGIQFIIIGDGAEFEALESAKKIRKIKNLKILPPQSRSAIKKYYSYADALLVHLRNIESFKYTIPSKIFEYMGSNKPIIYGLLGEAKKILDESKSGVWFFPQDVTSFISAVLNLRNNYEFYIKLVPSRKEFVVENYNREKIALKLLKEIQMLVEK